MSPRLAWSLFSLHIVALFIGTQMPSAWRSGVEQTLHAPFSLSSWAHFVVFFGMAMLLLRRPLACRAALATLQILVSIWWLRHHKQGPLEALWHRATWVGKRATAEPAANPV